MDLNELIRAASGGDLERAKALLDQDPGLALKMDESGATALHFAALNGHRAIARLLIERGADVNCRDGRFGATPAGWAIEYLRELGGQLGIELDDLAYAIQLGDARWVARFLARFPSLRRASDGHGTPFPQLACASGNPEISGLFETEEAS